MRATTKATVMVDVSLAGMREFVESNVIDEPFVYLGRYWIERRDLSFATFKLNHRVIHPDELGPLVRFSELTRALPEISISRHYSWLPTSDDRCVECGKSFSAITARYAEHKMSIERKPIDWTHENCRILQLERETLVRFREFLDSAGMNAGVLHLIENGYWPKHTSSDEYRVVEPWVNVRMPYGMVKFGHRKRVFEISWKDIVERLTDGKPFRDSCEIEEALDGEKIFKDEKMHGTSVTRGRFYVHAWGKEKLVEYLTRLHKLFLALTP